MEPPIPIPSLILFITIGVILVTITVELVAAEAINHIHYMGRHVGKAKQIASKMIQLAQNLSMNRRALSLGLTQIESIARFHIAANMDKNAALLARRWHRGRSSTAFEPVICSDLEFMDVVHPDTDDRSSI
uniref:CNNM transmembrane domain-containing protein n=1 Tax=Ascaris lumbricoides TaxID=6252 RepID=A0A0M3IS42_ASCLU